MITLQFVPYNELSRLTPMGRIKKILDIVKEEKIVLVEGRLRPEEEAELIQRTMEEVSKTFKGIELCTIFPERERNKRMSKQIKQAMVKMLIGDREGFTIIGPATIVKEIKKNPDKIELFTHNLYSKRFLGRRE